MPHNIPYNPARRNGPSLFPQRWNVENDRAWFPIVPRMGVRRWRILLAAMSLTGCTNAAGARGTAQALPLPEAFRRQNKQKREYVQSISFMHAARRRAAGINPGRARVLMGRDASSYP